MANEIRIRTNFVAGLVEDNPLTSSATLLTSAGLASLPVIDTTNHAAIILDPDGVGGSPEIVWVTAHTASATTATILRAQESTSSRQHERDTPWVHSATATDFTSSATWASYTPTWTADGTAPSIGDGTLAGRYLWEPAVYRLTVHIKLTWGTTTNGGTNGWHWTLPSGRSCPGSYGASMAGAALDVSGATARSIGAAVQGNNIDYISHGTDFVTSTMPWSWANGDVLFLSGTMYAD